MILLLRCAVPSTTRRDGKRLFNLILLPRIPSVIVQPRSGTWGHARAGVRITTVPSASASGNVSWGLPTEDVTRSTVAVGHCGGRGQLGESAPTLASWSVVRSWSCQTCVGGANGVQPGRQVGRFLTKDQESNKSDETWRRRDTQMEANVIGLLAR